MTKQCYVCKKQKDSEAFSINKSKKDGLSGRCKSCQKEYFKEYYKNNKEKHISAVRKSKISNIEINNQYIDKIKEHGCTLCKEKEKCILDFHHIQDKDRNISDLKRCSTLDVLKSEIEKCVLVCSNCHRKIHNSILLCDESFLISKTNTNFLWVPEEYINKRKSKERKYVRQSNLVKRKTKHKRIIPWPTNEELAKLVWEKSITSIAADIGISESEVYKRCKKLGIQKPKRGYWTKIKFNKII